MGKVKKGVKCSVEGCDRPAVRSISYAQFSTANTGLSVKEQGSRVYLCEAHYKEYKRASKKLKKLQKWRWMA